MNKEDTILIFGVTGYTGAWLVKKLVDTGYTNIIGTYKTEDKANYIKKILPSIELKKVDLITDKGTVKELIHQSKWIFNNTATFTGTETSVEEMTESKLVAIKNIFDAIVESETTKKIVHLGSIGAIAYGNTYPEKSHFDETDWSNIEVDHVIDPYMIIKTLEEKAIWEYQHSFTEKDKSIVVLHPTSVVGPSATPWQHDMIYANLKNGGYKIENQIDSVDVRDLADMAINLMNNEEANNIRILAKGFVMSLSELTKIASNTLSRDQIVTLFGDETTVIPADVALAVLEPLSWTNYYLDTAPRIRNEVVLSSIHADLYEYKYTSPTQTVKEALIKMYEDLENKEKLLP